MNFRQVRKKIKTISNVKQITKAMQMVSSVKMKKAQNMALEGVVFRQHLSSILARIVQKVDSGTLNYLEPAKNAQDRKLYLIIASNKGLCGSFNFNLAKLCIDNINFENSDFITVGKKGADFILKMRGNIIADFSGQLPFVDNTSSIYTLISEYFLTGKCNEVHIAYNRFVSTLKHFPTLQKLLPIRREFIEKPDDADFVQDKNLSYLIEPSPKEVLRALISDHIRDQIRSAIADSEASEYSARMIAMKNATDSATELIYGLTLLRNKLRQTSITNELLDITSASEITA